MKIRFSFLTGLVLTIASFMLFMIIFVIFSMRQPYDMTTENYYEKDLNYQQQIDKINRTNTLPVQPVMQYYEKGGLIELRFPPFSAMEGFTGSALLFRPSDAMQDRKFNLSASSGELHTLKTGILSTGPWQLQVEWISGELAYYKEFKFVVMH